MSNLSNVFKRLTTLASTDNVLVPYIRVTIGNFTIDTSDFANNRNIISLEYDKSGVGKCNKFTISIALAPDIINPVNPNKFEREFKKLDSNSPFTPATISYGYGNDGSLKSPNYSGYATDYNIEFNNGILYYTITGYSNVVEQIFDRHDFKPSGKAVDPVKVVEDTLKEFLGSSYEIKNEAGSCDKIEISDYQNMTVFDYANEVLKLAKSSNHENQYCTFLIEDTDSISKKKIIRLLWYPALLNSKVDNDVTFEWMGYSKSNIVLNFKPDFRGSLVLARNKSKNDEKPKYAMDYSGRVINTEKTDANILSGITANSDINARDSEWAKLTQYNYTATMTTLGLPCEIRIGEIIKVRPLVYGLEHHTAGTYMVTKVSDRIDDGGYITTFNLMKIV